MSMEKHKCKLCSRKFTSGKAMGGHMRSHLRALPLPPKTPPQKQDSGGGGGRSESTLVSEEEEEEEKHLGYGLRENPKKSCKIVDPDQFLDAGSVVHEKDQSETESNSKKPTKRRSKRTRRMFVSDEDHDTDVVHPKQNKSAADFEPVSSFSDSSPEEDIAVCLMMLSKDVWRNEEYSRFKDHKQIKYQCEICHKVLKSSQALGSHKTIHKKNNNSSCIFEDQNRGKSSSLSRQLRLNNEDQKVHECPYCGKIFGSGQALGGHKRSHILLSTSITGSSSSKVGDSLIDSSSIKFPYGFIDLNMPAPVEEDEDFSIS